MAINSLYQGKSGPKPGASTGYRTRDPWYNAVTLTNTDAYRKRPKLLSSYSNSIESKFVIKIIILNSVVLQF